MLKLVNRPMYIESPVRNLLTPRRLDIAVKWRFFGHLLNGGDPDAERVYRWHIQARSGARMAAGVATDVVKFTLDDYVAHAASMAASMRLRGFLPQGAIPLDLDGELLNGAHRVACAAALGIQDVPVIREARRAWAPAWGEAWFVANGMAGEDLARVRSDWRVLCLRQKH